MPHVSPYRILRSLNDWHNRHFRITRRRSGEYSYDAPSWAVDPMTPEGRPTYIPMWRLLGLVRVEGDLIHFPPSWNQEPVPLLPDEREECPSLAGEVKTHPLSDPWKRGPWEVDPGRFDALGRPSHQALSQTGISPRERTHPFSTFLLFDAVRQNGRLEGGFRASEELGFVCREVLYTKTRRNSEYCSWSILASSPGSGPGAR